MNQPAPDGPPLLDGFPSLPFIGREAELECLQALFAEAQANNVLRIARVVGQAGIGKTRLVQEWIHRLEKEGAAFELLRARADAARAHLPYALLRDLLNYRFHIREGDTPLEAREKLVAGVAEYLTSQEEDTAHWIGQLTGFDLSDSPHLANRLDNPLQATRRAVFALHRLLNAAVARMPLICILDDIQWADDSSIEGLETLAQAHIRAPVLVLCLERGGESEECPRWQAAGIKVPRIYVPPLGVGQSAACASLTLRAVMGYENEKYSSGSLATLPARLIDRVIERAGGSPYLIEELVRSLVELGVLVRVNDQDTSFWRVEPVQFDTAALLPVTLESALHARFARLPENHRQVLRCGAVIGQIFWDGALYDLCGVPAARIAAVLGELVRGGLLYRRESAGFAGNVEYGFRSTILREIALDSIPPEDLPELHAGAAAWLATACGERRDIYAAAIAARFETAGQSLESAQWYLRAAQQASGSFAPAAAARYYRRALQQFPKTHATYTDRMQIYRGLWDVYWWKEEDAEALAVARQMLAETETNGDPGGQAAAWNRIAAVENRQGAFQSALHSVQRAERKARAANDTHEIFIALFQQGLALYHIGAGEDALIASRQALDLHKQLHVAPDETQADPPDMAATYGDGTDVAAVQATRETANVHGLLGMIQQRGGHYLEAECAFRQALAQYRSIKDHQGAARTLSYLAANAYRQGDYETALQRLGPAKRSAHSCKDIALVRLCENLRAGALVKLGRCAEAEEILRGILTQPDGEQWSGASETYRFLALAALGQGRADEARIDAKHALELAESLTTGDAVEWQGRAWRTLGQVLALGFQSRVVPGLVSEQGQSAKVCFNKSLQEFIRIGAAGEQARTAREWAAYELRHGDPREGVRLWLQARGLFAQLGMVVEVERMDDHYQHNFHTGAADSNHLSD